MGAESARKYHYNQARSVVESLNRIIDRINPANYPLWLIQELSNSYMVAQCIMGERIRDMHLYGEKP